MEEKQIQEFVHRVSQDATLREELTSNPESVIAREGFSPRVTAILQRLAGNLVLNAVSSPAPSLGAWL